MGSIRTSTPVKHFVSMVATDRNRLTRMREQLEALYGRTDHEGSSIADGGEARVFLSFEQLIHPGDLDEIREQAKPLRHELDHGYIDNTAVHFMNRTMPLSQPARGEDFFHRAHEIYRSQLKTMCILNRKEPH